MAVRWSSHRMRCSLCLLMSCIECKNRSKLVAYHILTREMTYRIILWSDFMHTSRHCQRNIHLPRIGYFRRDEKKLSFFVVISQKYLKRLDSNTQLNLSSFFLYISAIGILSFNSNNVLNGPKLLNITQE